MVRRRKSRWFLRTRYWVSDHPIIWLVVPLLLLVMGISLFVVVERALKPSILTLAKEKSVIMATEAIHKSILDKLADSLNTEELVEYKTDQQGRIVLLQPNTARINRVISETTLAIQAGLATQSQNYFEIPFGQVFGSNLLAGMGPNIRVRFKPMGIIRVTPEETFEQAGINQTKHTIFLNVESVIYIVVPLYKEQVNVATKVPISTSIISGSVPNVFMQGNASATYPLTPEQKSQ